MTQESTESIVGRDEIRRMIRVEMGTFQGTELALCSASNHHQGMLAYQRGPNVYHCRCGQIYKKDGRGGLEEVEQRGT